MKAAVLMSNNCLIAVVLLGWGVGDVQGCNTQWIRLVYMMSCGKKKRESVWARNETFHEKLPSDFEGAFKYYREKDPFNPLFEDPRFYQILQEDDTNPPPEHRIPMLLAAENSGEPPSSTQKTSSILIRKMLPQRKSGNLLGIPGFPAEWDIEEVVDEKINENHRREINRLIEECCKVPPVTSCNGNTFSEACK